MAEGTQEPGRLLIGDLVVDVGQRRVSRGGELLDLPKLSFRFLYALAEAAPNVLTQDQLVAQVWPGRVISPETLTQRVKLVRQALGDDARNPRYVGLVRGEGYRLIAKVEWLPGTRERPALQFVGDLLRRNVIPVAGIYVLAAWATAVGLIAVLDALPIANIPRWGMALLSVGLVAGLPATVAYFWWRGGKSQLEEHWTASTEGRLCASAALLVLASMTALLAVLIYPTDPSPPNDIAVLPFDNRSPNPADELLGDGVFVGLQRELGDGTGLTVVARRSSERYRQADVATTTIAQQLAVRRLLTGILERVDDDLTLSIELVDGTTGSTLWADRYVLDAGGLLVVQQQIFSDVTAQLLPQSRRASLVSARSTENESANSQMMIADRYYSDALDRPVIDQGLLDAAIERFRAAVRVDPTSADLQSRLAAALLQAGQLDEAGEAIRAAEELDPNRSHVQHTLGLYRQARHMDGVGPHYARAVELNDSNVDALGDYGLYLWARADIRGAEFHLARAQTLDPMTLSRFETLGNYYGIGGFHDKARTLAQTIQDRFDDARGHLVIARIYELTGALDEAIAWALRAHRRDPELAAARWKLGELFTRIGDSRSAEYFDPEPSVPKLYFARQYDELIAVAEERWFDDESFLLRTALASAYAATGQYAVAVSMLDNYGLRTYLQGGDSATTSEIEAGVTLVDALKQVGQDAEARKLAEPLIELFRRYADEHPESWHPYINLACLYSVVDHLDQSLEMLETMSTKQGLPWYPRVKDQPCFREALVGNEDYQDVLDALAEQKQQLRARLPETLQRFGLIDGIPYLAPTIASE